MLEVYDKALKKMAILQNAFDVIDTEALNGVGEMRFKLPADDPKAAHCLPFSFVRLEDGDYYRILSTGVKQTDKGELEYIAEHAVATLVDDLMFGTHIIGNYEVYTEDVIRYILGFQTVPRWRLGTCDYRFQYEYLFESENLYNALTSVPNLFASEYQWTYDMTTAPWTLSLKRLDNKTGPDDFFIRAGRNLLGSTSGMDGAKICTRLYLLGYGEGINQLTIKDVNGGVPYLQSPQAYTDRYGLVSQVYVDRSFEDAESLMERGRTLLAQMQDPPLDRTFDVADLQAISGNSLETARVGKLAHLTSDGTTAFITGITRSRDKPGDMKIKLATTPTDIVKSVTDMASRQRIEQVYSQGATQIYAQSIQANADAGNPAELHFFFPAQMRIVNFVMVKITLGRFRSYNRTTSAGGGGTRTSTAAGASEITSNASGGGKETSGPSSKVTTAISSLWTGYPDFPSTDYAAGLTQPFFARTGSSQVPAGTLSTYTNYAEPGNHRHQYQDTQLVNNGSHDHAYNHQHENQQHNHYHLHAHQLDHAHNIDHTHETYGIAHAHRYTTPAHAHDVTYLEHNHPIEQGIFLFGSPTSAKVLVNGVEKYAMAKDFEANIAEALLGDGRDIPRGSFMRLGVLPNDHAYVTIDMVVQGFVQSRGGGTY